MRKRHIPILAISIMLALGLGLLAGCSAPEASQSQDPGTPAIYGADIRDGAPDGMIVFDITTNTDTDFVEVWQGSDSPTQQTDYLTHGDTRIWSFSYDVSGFQGSSVKMNVSAENAIATNSLALTIPIAAPVSGDIGEGDEGIQSAKEAPRQRLHRQRRPRRRLPAGTRVGGNDKCNGSG